MSSKTGNSVLRQLRESIGLSQREFATEAGIHHVYICQIETGVCQLGHRSGLAILDAFRSEMAERRITLEDLLRGEPGGVG